MKDITVSDSILYIGADDRDIDLFESQYVVPNGVSYNSYVILDEKVAVMDTVDARRGEAGLSGGFPYGAGSWGECPGIGGAIPGDEGGGECQDLRDDFPVF